MVAPAGHGPIPLDNGRSGAGNGAHPVITASTDGLEEFDLLDDLGEPDPGSGPS